MSSSSKSKTAARAPAKKASVGKPKFDLTASFNSLQDAAKKNSDDRFAVADKVVATQPSAFAVTAVQAPQLDLTTLHVGLVYPIPVSLIDPNPYSARYFYRPKAIQEIAETLKDTQDVALNGFVKNGRIELIDGGTRLRAAKQTGKQYLDVKIETPPTPKEQHKRSVDLNKRRTGHDALDDAVTYTLLMKDGIYKTQAELAQAFPKPSGKPTEESEISAYLSIGRIPLEYLQKMAEHEQTSLFTIAKYISDIFKQPDFEARQEHYRQIADTVIATIQAKELTKRESKALIDGLLAGPKTRVTAIDYPVTYGGLLGHIKLYPSKLDPSKQEIQFNLNGLDKAQAEEVKQRILKALDGHFNL